MASEPILGKEMREAGKEERRVGKRTEGRVDIVGTICLYLL
jgi:hypothetical protein